MKVAVFGCLHGMLNRMFAEVREYEEKRDERIDFIIVCGDCQTIRHYDDLQALSVPNKYKRVGDFPDYYSGRKVVPKLTIFVGGNHECSNYLMTIPFGGWVCPNMYYLGLAGVVKYRGFRIAGVSGIYNIHNSNKGRFERMPLDVQSIKSIYHTRRLEVFKLQLLRPNVIERPIDMFLSHDWPVGIYNYGDKEQLLRFKPNFKDDMESTRGLGNPLTRPLIDQLKPKRWFAAHMHCKFKAKVNHPYSEGVKQTDFLSLNKIENGRNFMDVLNLEPSKPEEASIEGLFYDEEWLTILRKTAKLDISSQNNIYCPRIDELSGQSFIPTAQEIEETVSMMNGTGGLNIDHDFRMVEPVLYNRPGNVEPSLDRTRRATYSNYQTDRLCSRLGIDIPEYLKQTSSVIGAISNFKPDSKLDIKPDIKPNIKSDVKPESGRQDCFEFYIDTKGES